MNEWHKFKNVMGSRAAATVGWPVAVVLTGILLAPYAARALAFLIQPATAAFLGGLIAVVLFRTLSSLRR
jgi:hypothetical protein